MKIAVFGCSWSYGVPELVDQKGNYLNWPYFLAKKTGWTIENYALGGSCVRWSLNNLQLLLKEKKDYYTIFQVTAPHRLTCNKPNYNYNLCRHNIFDNYYQYSTNIRNFAVTYQAKKINDKHWYTKNRTNIDGSILKMYESTIRYYPEEYFNNDYLSLIYYITSLSDLTFSHRRWLMPSDVLSMESEFGERFDDFCFDQGKHFNAEGLTYQAEFIKDLIDKS